MNLLGNTCVWLKQSSHWTIHTHTPCLSCFPQQQLNWENKFFFLFLCQWINCCFYTMCEHLSFWTLLPVFWKLEGFLSFCFCFYFWDYLSKYFCSKKAIHPINKKERNSNITTKKNQRKGNTIYFFLCICHWIEKPISFDFDTRQTTHILLFFHLWGYFCAKKAFYPTKQNRRNSNNIQLSKKKKRVNFSCICFWVQKKSYFCFDTEISSQFWQFCCLFLIFISFHFFGMFVWDVFVGLFSYLVLCFKISSSIQK